MKWLEKLPVVKVKFGCKTVQVISLFVAITPSGSMTKEFFYEYLDQVILPLFPKAGPGKLLRDEKGTIVRHPVIVKIDTGPGRLGASLKNIERREAALMKVIILLLGLPNSTSVSQELDWLFRIFKGMCRERTLALFAEKIKHRADKRKAGEAQDANVVSLSNDDLPVIVNGRVTDSLKNRPFDACFTRENVRKTFFRLVIAPLQ